MKIVRLLSATALALALSATAMAAPHPFYEQMLARGVAAVQGGRYAEGIRNLRIAAFGSLDQVASYQTAQVYLALAYEKLGESDAARLAATKFLQAERLQPAYDSLALDASTRNAFEKVVASAVEPQYLAQIPSFRRSAPKQNSAVATTNRQVPVTQPKTEADPPQEKPKPNVSKTTPATVPAPAVTQVAQTSSSSTSTIKPVINSPAPTQQPAVAPPQPRNPVTPPPAITPQPAAPQQPSNPAATQQLASAQNLLNEGKLLAAREAYLRLAQRRDLPRPQVLEIGRGLNRAGAWQESAFVYQRTLPLQKGEEQHMFFEAVNRYELGELNVARSLLVKALPGLTASREVELYRRKIQATE